MAVNGSVVAAAAASPKKSLPLVPFTGPKASLDEAAVKGSDELPPPFLAAKGSLFEFEKGSVVDPKMLEEDEVDASRKGSAAGLFAENGSLFASRPKGSAYLTSEFLKGSS